jgi:hypothetical protein
MFKIKLNVEQTKKYSITHKSFVVFSFFPFYFISFAPFFLIFFYQGGC